MGRNPVSIGCVAAAVGVEKGGWKREQSVPPLEIARLYSFVLELFEIYLDLQKH